MTSPARAALLGGLALALEVAKRQKGRAVTVRLSVPVAGSTVRVRLTAGKRRRVMGAAVKRGVAAGTLTLKVPLNRRGRAALRRARRLTLSVAVSITPPGGSATSAVRPVMLRR